MSRRDIYYWKCDRPAAFHGTALRGSPDSEVEQLLHHVLQRHFGTDRVLLTPGAGQGNHLTWNANVDGQAMFVRVENGPERDSHLDVESQLLKLVRDACVRTPTVFGSDASRTEVPFAWQALERIEFPDLNAWFKQGTLDVPQIAFEFGVAIARWQQIHRPGFGPFDETLSGYHATYADYFHLRLDEHLQFLVSRGFLIPDLSHDIRREIEVHGSLLKVESGCFVHKDLALWNALGSTQHVAAFIDFDDSICGDPTDDFSLLACFHDAAFLRRVVDGYVTIAELPSQFERRFWMHLLRNMLVKSVIRVGAGYFDRDDGFFLIPSGQSGRSFRQVTFDRLMLALDGLRTGATLDVL